MLKQLVALVHHSLSDLETSGGFATIPTIPPLFNGPEVLTKQTSLLSSQQLLDIPPRTEQK